MNMQTIIAAVVMVINSIGDVVDSWRVASYRVNFIGNLWNVAKNPSPNIQFIKFIYISVRLFVRCKFNCTLWCVYFRTRDATETYSYVRANVALVVQ